MEPTDGMNDMDDMEFTKLFSSLDSIKASEDLKSATLDAIFSTAGTDPTTPTGDDAENKVVKFPRNRSHHKNSHRLRIAGIAACFALLGTIGTAYNMPTSYACVDDGDTNVTIGINSMGMAVSADSDSEKGKKLIKENKLTNVDYRDSVGAAATGIAEHSDTPESTIELSVKSKDKAEGDSIKKGSSEAIEISGYKKNAKAASKTAGKKASDNASATASTNGKDSGSSNEGTDADSDEDNGGSSFTINTGDSKDQKSNTDATESVDPNSKYHPLSDDKKSSETETAESETTDSNSASSSASSSSAAETAAASSSASAEN